MKFGIVISFILLLAVAFPFLNENSGELLGLDQKAPLAASSFIIGATFAFSNFQVLYWSWRRIFLKKSIALATTVIVLKYALLAALIWFAIQTEHIQPSMLLTGFILGFAAVLLQFVLTKKREPELHDAF